MQKETYVAPELQKQEPLQWSIPEIVDTSETRESAQGGVLDRSSDAIPNHPKEKAPPPQR